MAALKIQHRNQSRTRNSINATIHNKRNGCSMYIAIDQYGAYLRLNKHPRKELMEMLGCKHIDKMYQGNADNTERYHVGYVLQNRWFTVYGLEGKVFATKQ